MIKRCAWVGRNFKPTELNFKYHDEEWGILVHDDKILFEFLILEGAKAGLS
jgi:DNA-3-methyladenine glycosylase I